VKIIEHGYREATLEEMMQSSAQEIEQKTPEDGELSCVVVLACYVTENSRLWGLQIINPELGRDSSAILKEASRMCAQWSDAPVESPFSQEKH